MKLDGKRVMISRTDSIGDVMLTLPICAWLKYRFPTVTIVFLGRGYTKPLIDAYLMVDSHEDWDNYISLSSLDRVEKLKELNLDVIIHVFPEKTIAKTAKKAEIKTRVGTSHRFYHTWTCNKRISFTRKRSELHESQLNHELLRPFGLKETPSLEQIKETTKEFILPKVNLPDPLNNLPQFTILHPKSKGSAKEWPIEKYYKLAENLAKKGQTVVFTGTKSEGELFKENLPNYDNIIDATGKLTLGQLICLIGKAKNLVACSTGPLHLSGCLGTNTIGLYSPKRPLHPGRWVPIGPHVSALVNDNNCPSCVKQKECFCIHNISVERVMDKLC